MGQLRFTDEELRRYSRQMVLAEVGGLGQARLRHAQCEAGDPVEALYLAAAGVGQLTVPTEAIAAEVRALNPEVTVRVDARVESAAASVTASAERALKRIRQILSIGTGASRA